jgi:hypothetical protein
MSPASLLHATTFSWLPKKLAVRSDLGSQPWPQRVADDHPEACRPLLDLRPPFSVRDIDLETARAVAWEGQV